MIEILAGIFAFILIGSLAKKMGWLGAGADKALNDYVYYISLPALILAKISTTALNASQAELLAANALPILLMMGFILLLWRLGRLSPRLAGALMVSAFFGNIVYMGLPIVQQKLGAAALTDAILIAAVYNIIIFTLGLGLVAWMSGKRQPGFWKEKLLKNTIIISVLAGIAISLSGLAMPTAVMEWLTTIGSSTTPVALVAMGAFLYGKNPLARLHEALLLSAFKLIIFPLLLLLSLYLFHITGLGAQVSLLEALMPLAVTNFVIAEKFGLDAEAVAQAVVVSTLLCIPLLAGFGMIAGWLPG